MNRSERRPCRILQLAGAGAAASLALSACSSSSSDSSAQLDSPASASGSDKLSGITVFAAASLKETFTTLGREFETEHPDTKVTFRFGGSDALAASITDGAPADVFASAGPKSMKIVTDSGRAYGAPSTFARNQLEIAVLPGNPDKIASLKDLTKSDLKVVLCDKAAPCGAAVDKALKAAKLKLTPVSYEKEAKSALNKVVPKEADAAVVYKTDVEAAGGKVEGVEFPESADAINDYPIALLKKSQNSVAAEAFIALVQSPGGQKALSQAGFLKP